MMNLDFLNDPMLGIGPGAQRKLRDLLQRVGADLEELEKELADWKERARQADLERVKLVQGILDDQAAELRHLEQLRAAGVRRYAKAGLTVELDPPPASEPKP